MHSNNAGRPNRIPRRRFVEILCVTVLGMSFCSFARAISYSVFSGSTAVGQVTVNLYESGVLGGFSSSYGSPRSLDAAAQIGNDDHFNWFQVIIADNDPLNDVHGVQLTPPYLDPPLGGYGVPDTQWADGLPWLWDEGADPPGGTPGFENGYNLNDVLEDLGDQVGNDGVDDFLFYEDFPGGPRGSSVSFRTWLVSLDEGGSLHEFHQGFQWTWSNPSGGEGMSQILPQPLTPAQGLAMYSQLVPPKGDYNDDGTVDAADYVVWRKGLENISTQNHYNIWRTHFGESLGNGSGADAIANSTVPEPATALMLSVGLLATALAFHCRRTS